MRGNYIKHAPQRAAQRGITERQFATAMAYGTKYVDKNTGVQKYCFIHMQKLR
jgi:hypothetical protein